MVCSIMCFLHSKGSDLYNGIKRSNGFLLAENLRASIRKKKSQPEELNISSTDMKGNYQSCCTRLGEGQGLRKQQPGPRAPSDNVVSKRMLKADRKKMLIREQPVFGRWLCPQASAVQCIKYFTNILLSPLDKGLSKVAAFQQNGYSLLPRVWHSYQGNGSLRSKLHHAFTCTIHFIQELQHKL